jgi:eukaryotic-like serine/threonine-protein kinase
LASVDEDLSQTGGGLLNEGRSNTFVGMPDPVDLLNRALADRYRVEREIGAGGMATVYLARDLKHGRNVALKLLKPELGAVLGVERFLSEITVTANLQHPNLLPLFDSGAADGLLFYVMPYVEGESLRARLAREKQLPVDDAVRIAVAVAGALDYAHRHGVIHRDLKPENILLHEGQPLVADFGIALAVSNAGGARVTQTGLSLGTPQYMSPEQATGDRVIDGRSDIYSLAAVTYEMLTGEPPHTGATAQAIIARVLTEQPRSVRASRPSVPEHVERALEGALEKLAADRWPSAGQFADVLQGRGGAFVSRRAARDGAANAARARGPRERLVSAAPWVLAAVLAIVAALAWASLLARRDPAPTRFTLSFPANTRFENVNGTPVVISPDGRAVVYSGRSDKGSMLYYRPLDDLRARPLAGTDGAATPFFSPDGHSVGFSVLDPVQAFKTVPVAGGGGTTVASTGLRGLTWTSTGQIVGGSAGGLMRVSAGGGQVEQVTKADRTAGITEHSDPFALADGQTVIYYVGTASDAGGLAVFRLDSRETRRLEGPATNAIGMIDGWLLFGRSDGTIVAAPFDARTTRSLRDAVPLVEGVLYKSAGGVAASLSREGSLAYVRSANTTQMVIVDEHGARTGTGTEQRRFSDPRFSPDGRKVAVTVTSDANSRDIWVWDVATGVLHRTTTSGSAMRPEWSADGKRIAYIAADSAGKDAAWWVSADNSGPEEKLYSAPGATMLAEVSLSPDGKYAVLRTGSGPVTGRDIWLLPLAGERTATPLVASRFNENQPAVSLDGRWLAYVSDESGAAQVYVRPFPGLGVVVQVSSGAGASEPVWARDGRLVYRTGNAMFAATLTAAPTLAVARQQLLFEDPTRRVLSRPQFSIHPDGKRFVVLRAAAEDENEVVVVLNWITEVRAKLARAGKR